MRMTYLTGVRIHHGHAGAGVSHCSHRGGVGRPANETRKAFTTCLHEGLARDQLHADGCAGHAADLITEPSFYTVLAYPHDRWDGKWHGHTEFAAHSCGDPEMHDPVSERAFLCRYTYGVYMTYLTERETLGVGARRCNPALREGGTQPASDCGVRWSAAASGNVAVGFGGRGGGRAAGGAALLDSHAVAVLGELDGGRG